MTTSLAGWELLFAKTSVTWPRWPGWSCDGVICSVRRT